MNDATPDATSRERKMGDFRELLQDLESVGCPEALQTLGFTTFSSTYLQLNLIFTMFLSSSLDRTPESCSSLSRILPKTRFSAFQNSW